MIYGIGIDAVQISRFEEKINNTPGLRERIFMDSELDNAKIQTLAGRFAVKEAVIKAFNAAPEVTFYGIEVDKESTGKPVIWLHGEAAKLALRLGVRKLHVSITHDGDMAIAYVIAEGADNA